MRLALLTLPAIILAGCAALPSGNLSSQIASIEKVHAQVVAAAEKRDADGMYAYILNGEGVIIENGAVRESRQEALDATNAGFQRVQSIKYQYDHHRVTILSRHAAIWIGNGTTNAVLDDGRQVAAPFAESAVFVRQDGKWMIRHAHFSRPLPG